MILKFLILFQIFGFLAVPPTSEEGKVKAWIEIEGMLDEVSVRAVIENLSEENMFLNYELEMHNRSRIKDYKTLQKGKLMALRESIIELSEERLNVRTTQLLCVRIKVLKDDKVIAIDSIIFQGVK